MNKLLIAALLLSSVSAFAQSPLTLYTNREPALIQPVLDEFTKQTSLKVIPHFLNAGILERLELEGEKTPADVVLLTDGALMVEAKNRALIKGEFAPLSLRSRVIYASNTRVIENQLTYENLQEAKWKGKICIRQGSHPYNVTLVSAMLNHNGEQRTESWLNGVKANLARKPAGGDRDVARDIAAGLCDIGLGNIYYIGLMSQDEKQKEWIKSIKVINPTFGNGLTHVNMSVVAETKSNANTNQAKQFIDFLKSDAAQNLFATLNFEYPVAKDVKPSSLLSAYGEMKPDTLAIEKIAEKRKAALDLILKTGFDK